MKRHYRETIKKPQIQNTTKTNELLEKGLTCYDVSGSCSVEYEPEQIINE